MTSAVLGEFLPEDGMRVGGSKETTSNNLNGEITITKSPSMPHNTNTNPTNNNNNNSSMSNSNSVSNNNNNQNPFLNPSSTSPSSVPKPPPPSIEKSPSGSNLPKTTSMANSEKMSGALPDKNAAKGSSDKDKRSGAMTIVSNNVTYVVERVLGNGSFGVVVLARVEGTGELVAIKKVLQDKRYKNREKEITQLLNHCNIVALRTSFYTEGPKRDEVYLNLVLEYVPEPLQRVNRKYAPLPVLLVKLYMYQMFRALAYIHSLRICHRDIKPQNVLVDAETHVLKICDFGSAKILEPGQPNVAYICSRYYRAPELIFGATEYSIAIDMWSAGCILAELFIGKPLFAGETQVDQLIQIVKVLGTPTKEQVLSMNREYTDYKFPEVRPKPWAKVLASSPKAPPPEALDLLAQIMQYTPSTRLTAWKACAHPFFDELRNPRTVLPNGRPLPPLFNFSEEELKSQAGLTISKKL